MNTSTKNQDLLREDTSHIPITEYVNKAKAKAKAKTGKVKDAIEFIK